MEWRRFEGQKEGKGRKDEESDLGDNWHEGKVGAGGKGGNLAMCETKKLKDSNIVYFI